MRRDAHPKTAVVTGATSGIGLAVAEGLVRNGYSVIGVGRSPERCRVIEERLRKLEAGGQVDYLVADLALQSEVRRLGGEIRERVEALDGLVNNAAVVPFHQVITSEGFDMQWAVNHLAAFLLTHELLPALKAAPLARVVTVSSGSHYAGRINWEDLQLFHHYSLLRAYQQTKLCNVLFTAELNRCLGPDSNVRAFVADPGLVNTGIGQKSNAILARWVWAIRRRGGITPEESARGIIFLVNEPTIQEAQEIYWKHGHPKLPNPNALEPEAASRLWEETARMCGIQPEDFGVC